MNNIIDKAKNVIEIEINGLQQVQNQIGKDFSNLVNLCVKILDSGGKIITSGVGKSGHIGRKISATLASTGSPSVFMHPVEALHGDLGLMQKNDLLIAFSYSGETDELLAILPSAKRLGIPIVAFTGSTDSKISQWSDITVRMTVEKEACPFNLAPTTTSVAQLAMGDALAMVLLDIRGFTQEDYGRLHPGGAIGRAVTLRVSDIMRTRDKIATITSDKTVKDCLLIMTKKRCGSAVVIDNDEKLLGIFTDGDFRRHVEEDLSVLDQKIETVMTAHPSSVNENELAVTVLKIVETKKIDDIIVLNHEGKVVGMVDIQDLPGLKLM